MKRQRLTNEERAEIIELGKQGAKHRDIATWIGCSYNTVGYVLRESGLKRKRSQLCKVDPPEAKRLYEAGATMNLIAVRFGATEAAVSRCLKRQGVKARPAGRRKPAKISEPYLVRVPVVGTVR
ncbi:MAG: helix-turn-helix domain-containing protein [Methyloceanibacter sp.]|nr:helix-turn-helix domain-containing protein [Methyloceanibacter sp.]